MPKRADLLLLLLTLVALAVACDTSAEGQGDASTGGSTDVDATARDDAGTAADGGPALPDDARATEGGDAEAGDDSGDATLADGSADDASDAASDAGAVDAGDASDAALCAADQPLAADLDALYAALAAADTLGLVSQPDLTTLRAKADAIDADLETLRSTCSLTLQADLATRIPALKADVDAWVLSNPIGMTSSPPSFVLAGGSVAYTPRLADGATGFAFALAQAPAGATIDAGTGLMTFSPAAAQKGLHDFVIEATKGATIARQAFRLAVSVRTVLTVAPLTSAAATVTVTGSGSPLDGAEVTIPVGLIATTDTLTLAMIDPAPPIASAVRLALPGLELSFASGLDRFNAPVGVALPSFALGAGEVATLFAWHGSPQGARRSPAGSYQALTIGAASLLAPATVTGGATAGAPVQETWGNYDFWMPPGTSGQRRAELMAAIANAHVFFFQDQGYFDPTSATVRVTVTALDGAAQAPCSEVLGTYIHPRRITLCPRMNSKWLRNVAAHEVYHMIQFTTPPAKLHGELQLVGGARWWVESTASFAAEQATGAIGFAPYDFRTSRSVTEEGDLEHAYDAAIVFNYLVRRQGFDLKQFWETVSSAQLMAANSAGDLLALHTDPVNGVFPLVSFVHAMWTDRSALNFVYPSVLTKLPTPTSASLSASGAPRELAPSTPIPYLSAQTFRVQAPSRLPVAPRLKLAFTGTNVALAVFAAGSATPLAELSPSATEADLPVSADQQLILHVVNKNTNPTGNGTFALSARISGCRVAAGNNHTCLVKSDGSLWCWGGNYSGQLGDGTKTQRLTPTQVTSIGTTANIPSAKFDTSCAVKADGTLWCWGANFNGQVGDGTSGGGVDKTSPTAVVGLTAPVRGVVTGTTTCAVLTDGTVPDSSSRGSVWCWGGNVNNMLAGAGPNRPTPGQVPVVGDRVEVVASSGAHACVVRSDSTMWCWGYDPPTFPPHSATPYQVATSVFNIAVGGRKNQCALKDDSTLWCWGENQYGQVGDGTYTERTSPVQTGAGTLGANVAQVTMGDVHSCALKTDNTVWCWGRNPSGQLGTGSTLGQINPTRVGAGVLGTLTGAIDAGWTHTCAIKTDGSVWCWGANTFGQIGDGTTSGRLSPVQVASCY